MPITPPATEAELMSRANCIAGVRLGDVARALQRAVPADLRKAKGWVGELLEAYLGATAGSLPEPDFPHLGIELKTVPVRANGKPTESTYVCVVALDDNLGARWEYSLVRRKLARVLWLPIEAERQIPLPERRIGNPLLWSPSGAEERVLRADFEELMDMVCLGELDQLSAHYGTWLQIRPKALNASARTLAADAHGAPILTLPRGFYLRTSFTERLFADRFA
jgi:DNA mismatch repair protein MutH